MWLLLIPVGAVAVVLLLAASKPAQFRVERSVVIAAPADHVFSLINSFRQWEDWSPWAKLDPQMTTSYSGPDAGVGCKYAWEGNKKVGRGSMEIVQSDSPTRVALKVHFLVPFEALNETEFVLTPDAARTRVVWAMTGSSPLMMRVMGVFMNMDNMIGRDFEKGLSAMKVVAEG
jgi:hypothetical protein